MQPEELLEEFLTLTNVKVGKVRVDNEFPASSNFEAFCKKCHIVVCPSVAYTHDAGKSGRSSQDMQGTCMLPSQGQQHTCSLLALFSSSLVSALQLLARIEDDATLEHHGKVKVLFQHGAGLTAVGVLHGGEASAGTSSRQGLHPFGLSPRRSFPGLA
eukprot:2849855-Rhodomonas_salina.1